MQHGAPQHSTLWTVPSAHASASEATTIDTSRPCVFFFGGEDYMCRNSGSIASQHRMLRDMIHARSRTGDFHFYTLTDSTPQTDGSQSHHGPEQTRAGANNVHYNDRPLTYFSADAEHFTDRYLIPLVRPLSGLTGEARADALDATCKQFSALTFLGYSYGTALIQEVRNVLCNRLSALGYTEKETAKSLTAMAAVNIGASFSYVPKYPDISQVTLVWSKDKDAVHATGISPASTYLEFEHPAPELAVAERENHRMLYITGGSNRLRSLHFEPVRSSIPLAELVKTAANPGPQPTIDVPARRELRTVVPHHKQLQIARFSQHIDATSHDIQFPSNLVGLNSSRLLGALVQASADAIKAGTARDTIGQLDGYLRTHCSAKAIRADQQQIAFFKQVFDAGMPGPGQGQGQGQ